MPTDITKNEKKDVRAPKMVINAKEARDLKNILLDKDGANKLLSNGITKLARSLNKMEFVWSVAKIVEELKEKDNKSPEYKIFKDNLVKMLSSDDGFLALSAIYPNSYSARWAIGVLYNSPVGQDIMANVLIKKPTMLKKLIKLIANDKVKDSEQEYDYNYIFKMDVERPYLDENKKKLLNSLENYLNKNDKESLKVFIEGNMLSVRYVLASDEFRKMIYKAIKNADSRIRLLRFLSSDTGQKILKDVVNSIHKFEFIDTVGYLFNKREGRTFLWDLIKQSGLDVIIPILRAQLEAGPATNYDPAKKVLKLMKVE